MKGNDSTSTRGRSAAVSPKIKSVTTIERMKRKLDSLKGQLEATEKGKEVSFEDDNSGDDHDAHGNAGDQLGGRKKKKQKKAEHTWVQGVFC